MPPKRQKSKKVKPYEPKMVDGELNPKYVDLLDEDKPISGQHYYCASFVTPENIIKDKQMFKFEEFLKQWDINKSMLKFLDFLHFVCYTNNIDFDVWREKYMEFVKEEKQTIYKSEVEGDFKTYIENNDENLEEKYKKKHGFQTSVRGLKIRGSFDSEEECKLRCKMLQKLDPNHDIFVGMVGKWTPLDPVAYKTGKVEYMEEELNRLFYEKNKNDQSAKQEFEKYVKDKKVNAIEENKRNAEKYGVKLTQTIDENGNLVSIKNTNTQEKSLDVENVTEEMIRNELFEGENVIMEKKTDNGLSRLPESTRQQMKEEQK